jgi:hypothetical protein
MNFKLFIETFPIFALNSRRNKNWMKEQSKHARWLVRLKQKSFISVQHFCHSLLRLVKGTSQSHQTKLLLHRYTVLLMIFWMKKSPKHATVWQNGFVPGIFILGYFQPRTSHSIAEHRTCFSPLLY